jgi:tRNA (guanine37-N1)-methyltransferase
MKISILTLFPEMFEGFINTSIINKAILKGLVEIECIDIRSFSLNKHHRVDDTPFGGGQGLVMTVQPIMDALASIRQADSYVLMSSAQGKTFNQKKARSLQVHNHIIIICGHYEGVDERVIGLVDEEISIGDYILTGGEIATMAISDAIIRLQEGVIKEASHLDESFEMDLLEYPQYTKPASLLDMKVPDVLLSGHHENIRLYRLKESLRMTWLKRPDLFKDHHFTNEEAKLLAQVIIEETKKG